MNLGAAIRELRKDKGFTQLELAIKAGITQTALSKIEKGNKPNDKSIKSIAEVLKIPLPLLYVYAIEAGDIPENKKETYNKMFPLIKLMIAQMVADD